MDTVDKLLRNTTFVRILALVLGILLWAIIRLDVHKTTATVPVDLQTKEISNVGITVSGLDNTHYSIKSLEPSKVTIRLRGKDASLRKVNTNTYKIVADLSNYTAGSFSVPLKGLNFPSGVEVEIYPSTVTISMEEKLTKELPVLINPTGAPAEGFIAGQPIVSPNKVHVTVPSSVMDRVDSVRADLSIDGAKSAVKKQVKLQAFDKEGKQIDAEINPSVVEVEIPITSPLKTMPLQIKVTGQLEQGYSIAEFKQSVDKISVFGDQSELDKLEFYDGLSVDVTGLKEDKHFTLQIPKKSKITLTDPQKVDVDIKIVPSLTRTIDQVPIIISGQNDGGISKIITPDSGKISVTIEGAPDIVNSLKPEDVQAILDVSNLPVGQHDVVLIINLPPFVKRATADEIKVKVEISTKSTAAESSDNPSAKPVGTTVDSTKK